MTYEIQTGVAKPLPPAKKPKGTTEKYPASKLEVGQHFVVPKSEMLEGDTPLKFRNRIHHAVRAYRLKTNKDRALDADYNPETFVPVDFSTILLGDPTEPGQKWENGDVGVWRDS